MKQIVKSLLCFLLGHSLEQRICYGDGSIGRGSYLATRWTPKGYVLKRVEDVDRTPHHYTICIRCGLEESL